MRNVIIAVLVLGLAGFLYTSWKIERDVRAGVDQAVFAMSPYAVVQYDGVSATLTGELTVDGIRARVKGFKDEFYIDRIGIDTPSFLSLMKFGDMEKLARSGDNFLPSYFGFVVEGFRMPVDADYGELLYQERLDELGIDLPLDAAAECTGKYGLSPDALKAMGYEEYDIHMSAAIRQGETDYAVELASGSEDMWLMEAQLMLDGNLFTEMKKGARYRPTLTEIHVEYIDESLHERIEDYCEGRDLTAEQTRAALLDAFAFLGTDNGIEFGSDIMDAYDEYLDGHDAFVVTAKPRDPIEMSKIDLYSPKDVPALLQLQASVR